MSQKQKPHPLDKFKGACRFCKEPSEIISYTCGWCGRIRYFLLVQIDDLPESEGSELVIPVTLPETSGVMVHD